MCCRSPIATASQPSFEVATLADLRTNDYWWVGGELLQIATNSDDLDVPVGFRSYRGQRLGILNTTPLGHEIDTPMYKVEILEPGKTFPPNGLPVFHLNYRNDDGGPGYGRDSRLDFTVPRDGEYLLHLKDARGLQGEDFAYRMTISRAGPDFELSASPENPNVPRGGRVPVVVTANRTLGYQGPIAVEVKGLPEGLTADPAMIPAGQYSTVVSLRAAPDASLEGTAGAYEIVGKASAHGRNLVRVADTGAAPRVVSIVPPPDIRVWAGPQQIVLAPGKEAKLTLHVDRKNGFSGRVPCDILNLPPGVRVFVGISGVVVFPNETSRTITLRAESFVQPMEQPIYAVGTVESNSPTVHTSDTLHLSIRTETQP